MSILNLGLRKKPGTVHYPMIRIAPLDYKKPKCPFDTLIFTSQTAVDLYLKKGGIKKPVVAVGQKTKAYCEQRGFFVKRVAQIETAEGVVDILEGVKNESYLWPHSENARSVISDSLKKRGVLCAEWILYRVDYQALKPIPNLELFDEILFTSPSTVDSFFNTFKQVPKRVKCTPIGPITKSRLNNNLKFDT